MSRALPRSGERAGRILFLTRPEKKAPLERSQIRETSPEDIAANPPIEAEVRVNKVHAMTGRDYTLCAYEVEWLGQPVIAHDPAASTTLGVGDIAVVRVMRVTSPDRSRSYGLLDFFRITERSAAQRKRW